MLEAPKSDPLSGLSSSGKKESRRERDCFFHPAPPTSISRSGRKKWGDRARARRDIRFLVERMLKELDFCLKRGSGGNFNNYILQHFSGKNNAA